MLVDKMLLFKDRCTTNVSLTLSVSFTVSPSPNSIHFFIGQDKGLLWINVLLKSVQVRTIDKHYNATGGNRGSCPRKNLATWDSGKQCIEIETL